MKNTDMLIWMNALDAKYLTEAAGAASPQQKRSRIRRTLPAMIAAAAAVLCLTVGVGAAADWDYKSLFTEYFTKQSDAPVSFDLEGMGKTLGFGQTFPSCTVTFDSVLADSNTAYLVYSVEPQGKFIPDAAAHESYAFYLGAVLHSADGTVLDSGNHIELLSEEGNKRQYAVIFTSQDSTLLPARISLTHVESVVWAPAETHQIMRDVESWNQSEFEMPSEISLDFVQEADVFRATPQPVALRDYALTAYTVSPLGMVLTDEAGMDPNAANCGIVEYIESETDVVFCYADGTEIADSARLLSVMRRWQAPDADHPPVNNTEAEQNPGTVPCGVRCNIVFSKPLSTEGLTAIRIGGVALPVG